MCYNESKPERGRLDRRPYGNGGMKRIYLDQASTSFPKAPGTAEAVFRYMTECGCNAARGDYAGAYSADELLYDTREQLCRLFRGGEQADPKSVVFTKNVTERGVFVTKIVNRDARRKAGSVKRGPQPPR